MPSEEKREEVLNIYTASLLGEPGRPRPESLGRGRPSSIGRGKSFHPNEVGLLSIGTAVLWVSCAAVGILGLVIPYPTPPPQATPTPPVQAQIVHVELTKRIAPVMSDSPVAPSNPSPSAAPETPAPLAPAAVAAPSPSIAFAVPIAGPVKFVPANQAIATPINRPAVAPAQTAPKTAGQPTRLILGQGEGRQPAPQYPFEAIRQDQEGTVVVRFSVDENGAVAEASAITPCPYPLLNQAALEAVRNTWHFVAGQRRSYEVSIQFQLQRK
ncbi:MAG TPA: energy transducer TonB [Tepidisphaeraceae bacterium]|jgi:protein TonB